MVGGKEGFKDRQDLINTLAASAYVPLWSGRSLFTSWRGMETADGSLSTQQPCPPGTQYCIRVASRWQDLPRPTASENINAIWRSLSGATTRAGSLFKAKLPETIARPAPETVEAMKQRGVDIAPGLSVKRDEAWDAQTWTEVGACGACF